MLCARRTNVECILQKSRAVEGHETLQLTMPVGFRISGALPDLDSEHKAMVSGGDMRRGLSFDSCCIRQSTSKVLRLSGQFMQIATRPWSSAHVPNVVHSQVRLFISLTHSLMVATYGLSLIAYTVEIHLGT